MDGGEFMAADGAAQFYHEFGYVVVPRLCSSEEAAAESQRMKLSRQEEIRISGRYSKDRQVVNAYSKSRFHDNLLYRWQMRIAAQMGIRHLKAASSYSRIYEHGAELHIHRDRLPLQHSATVCLSRDQACWDLCLYDLKGNFVRITQEVGDALLYQGRLEHWRDGPYQGSEQVQVFLHYYNRNSIRVCIFRILFGEGSTSHRQRMRQLLGPLAPYVVRPLHSIKRFLHSG